MSTSKEDEDEEVVFEGVRNVSKNGGESSIAAKRVEKSKVNGLSNVHRPPPQSSSEDTEDSEDEYESESDEPLRLPKYKKPEKSKAQMAYEDEFSRIQFQRPDDPRALLTHETLCNLRSSVESLSEVRDPDFASTTLHGVTLPDPIHAIRAIDHNLWVLASAASLRLNEVAGRCLKIEDKKKKKEGEEEEPKKEKPSLADMLPKALAALSGQQVGFKEKVPEKPKGKGRAAPAPAASKPVTRERPVREKPEPKKRPPPKPKEENRTKPAQTRSNTAQLERQSETPAVAEAKNGGKGGAKTRAAKKDGTPAVTTNTRKRKAAAEEKEGEGEEKEKEKKETTKAPAKAKAPAAKRSSARAVKKTKENEPTYCHCNRISFGEMVGCDNETCTIEWFHFECINIKAKPKGKWYCPDCRIEPNNSKLPKKQQK